MRQPGDFIGRFRIERLLGEGGIAQVYQVRHRQFGTVHALKLCRPRASAIDCSRRAESKRS